MDNNRTELSVVDYAPVSAETLRKQVNAIQEAMKSVMKEGTHFGVIPGCGDKPSLWKPGAEKIGMMFRLLASFDAEIVDLGNGHREYRIKCSLRDLNNLLIGQGVGSCSTLESKYRWRAAERTCPNCGKPTIIKGKAEYGGGWLCFAKKGGCGSKFPEGDKSIEGQLTGRAENQDIADVYNTVLKMAKKRSHVDAILTCTAASDIFTQDIEDMPEVFVRPDPARKQSEVVMEPEASREIQTLNNPWLWIFQGTDAAKASVRGKYLADMPTSAVEAITRASFRNKITPEDLAHANAALANPEMKEFAIAEIKAAQQAEQRRAFDADEIPNFEQEAV